VSDCTSNIPLKWNHKNSKNIRGLNNTFLVNNKNERKFKPPSRLLCDRCEVVLKS